jgi:hypothetical protein
MAETLAIVLPLLTIGLTIWFISRIRRQRKPKNLKVDERTRQERAVWAWGNILSSDQGPVSSFGVARVEMQLEVHLPGSPVYPAKVTWLVDKESLAFVEVGKELALKVDPQGPKYIYPNGSWAKSVE